MRYIITNGKRKLDRFQEAPYCGAELHYSSRSYIMFQSIEEAEKYIGLIQTRCAARTRTEALRLRVEVDA
jgi:hypothetical protein